MYNNKLLHAVREMILRPRQNLPGQQEYMGLQLLQNSQPPSFLSSCDLYTYCVSLYVYFLESLFCCRETSDNVKTDYAAIAEIQAQTHSPGGIVFLHLLI